MASIRRKVFLSYHHEDQDEVDRFVKTFDEHHDVFIARALGCMQDDVVNSENPDYVMQRIRDLYLKDSTVTVVLIGKCTWARRFVDWEIQASLRHGEKTIPNGLLGVKLQSYDNKQYPDRLNKNLKPKDSEQEDCYARVISYPKDSTTLSKWIEDAFDARTSRVDWIVNPRDRFKYNRTCP